MKRVSLIGLFFCLCAVLAYAQTYSFGTITTTNSTSCTNQFLTALSTTVGSATCTTPTLASAQFANQGTTTTLLHGNGAGNPSFTSVVTADIAANAVTSAKVDGSVGNATTASFSTLTDGATITWAIASAYEANAGVTLAGNRTLNITNPVNGGTYVLKVIQDGTGSRTLALGTGCTWKVSGGGAGTITPSTAANAIDTLAWVYDGANCLAVFTKNFN